MWFADWTRTAWPEVYFPGVGWVEFEPTAGQDPLDRPLPPQDAANANNFNSLNDLRTENNRDFASREQINEGVTAPVEPAAPVFPTLYLIPLLAIVVALTVFSAALRAYRACSHPSTRDHRTHPVSTCQSGSLVGKSG